jgi:hypothetical protein
MAGVNYISPDESAGGKGIGPEDNSRYPQIAAKQQGFLAIAFGLALGLTLIILYLLLRIPNLPDSIAGLLPTFWGNTIYTIGVYFIGGLIIGSVLSIIYNLLLHKRFDLFGLDHSID